MPHPAFLALTVLILTLPLSKARFFVGPVPIYLPEWLCLFAATLFLFNRIRVPEERIRRLPGYVLLGAFLILSGLLLSLASSKNPGDGLGIFKGWFLFPMLFGWLFVQLCQDQKNIRWATLAWYASAVAVALAGLAYYLSDNLTYDGRLRAFYQSPNHLAMTLVPGVFLGWHFLRQELSGRKHGALARKERAKAAARAWAAFTSWSCLLAALYLTLSYAAWLSTLAGFLVVFLAGKNRRTKRRTLIAAVAFLAVVSALTLSQYRTSKFQDFLHVSERSSLASRLMIWQSAFRMLQDQPVTGIGPGSFQSSYLEYQKHFPPYLEWAVPQPHNLYLAFWLESSLVGLVGFLLLVFVWMKDIRKSTSGSNQETAALAAVLLGAMTAVLVHGAFDTPYWKLDLAYAFWTLAALGLSLRLTKDESHLRP
jgi:O-antigen ligase